MNTTYTAGPWTIEGPSSGMKKGIDDGGDYAIVANGEIIAEAIHRTSRTNYEPAAANASLIAAAPELLEALEKVTKRLEHMLVKAGISVMPSDIRNAHAALAKATDAHS